jgi:hypothetical protein
MIDVAFMAVLIHAREIVRRAFELALRAAGAAGVGSTGVVAGAAFEYAELPVKPRARTR